MDGQTCLGRKPAWRGIAHCGRDEDYLAVRPEKSKLPEHDKYVFLTQRRQPWFRDGRFVEDSATAPKVAGIDGPVSKAFAKLLKTIDINGHRGFHSLRHGFETIGSDTGDQVSVNAIMGTPPRAWLASTVSASILPGW